MNQPQKPDYIPEEALRWAIVTDGKGRRVGAWVERPGVVRIFDPGEPETPWVMFPDGVRERWNGDVLNRELFEQCDLLHAHSGSGYVSIDEPENAGQSLLDTARGIARAADADEHETPSGQVRIVQILFAPDASPWRGFLLGLGEDGRVYRQQCGEWLLEAGRVGEEGSAGE